MGASGLDSGVKRSTGCGSRLREMRLEELGVDCSFRWNGVQFSAPPPNLQGKSSRVAPTIPGQKAMHYKRKAHRGRGKVNTMDNNSGRLLGNSTGKECYSGRKIANHVSASYRNRVAIHEIDGL